MFRISIGIMVQSKYRKDKKGGFFMSWDDFKKKMCSRKFWLSVAGLVTGIMLAFKVDAQTAETVSGVIMAAASVIAYIFGEGLVDAARTGTEDNGLTVSRPENFMLIKAILEADEKGLAFADTIEAEGKGNDG